MPRTKLSLLLISAVGLLLSGQAARAQGRVSFVFTVASASGNPFERDVRAEVSTPAGMVSLPAFYVGGTRYCVRAAALRPGVYRLGAVVEVVDGRQRPLRVRASAPSETVKKTASLPFVRVDPLHARRLASDRGSPYVPVGTNLGWGPPGQDPTAFYQSQFADLGRLGVNWVRIWLAHWGGLNLDWRLRGASPAPGALDSVVARRLDDIVDAAAGKGIYIQLVLQHHGQFSTQVNPNWPDNPWSAAHPRGFLTRPADFFTSPQARRLTRAKYRYIVARWGYSPAILAWELFNEVQWVDALRIEHDEAAVAAWHAEMADYIRAIDPYHHPVTTSYDDLASPIFARMDFLQPHLYAGSGIAPLRQFYTTPPADRRPLFYGETGFDNFSLSAAERRSGLALVHPLWAGLMGEAEYPAQMWYWDRLVSADRHAEFAQFVAFVRAAGLGRRPGLQPFSPAVESETHVPLVVARSRNQGARPYPEIVVPGDGSEPVAYADVPQFLAGASSQARGPGESPPPRRISFRVHYPAAASGAVHFDNVSARGSAARVTVDGSPVAERVWSAADSGTERLRRPGDLEFAVPAGDHVVSVESTGQSGLEVGAIDLGLPVPALAAIGKRTADFVMFWVGDRAGFMTGAPAARATLVVSDLPPGVWKIRWWGVTAAARMPPPTTVSHSGGTFRLPTPAIGRFAAVTLEAAAR